MTRQEAAGLLRCMATAISDHPSGLVSRDEVVSNLTMLAESLENDAGPAEAVMRAMVYSRYGGESEGEA